MRCNEYQLCYLSFPNFSCHLPLATTTGAAFGSTGVSSMVSCRVAMATRAGSGICVVEDEALVGDRRMSALEVFFCRSEYVFPGVFRTAELSDEERLSLSRTEVNG